MKLPSVFANKIDTNINNSDRYVYGRELKEKMDLNELFNCFDRNGYVNKLKVVINTGDDERLYKLVLKKNNYFVDINNEKIYFDSIKKYEIKK